MGESSLTLEYDDFVIEVGQFMSFGGAPSGSITTTDDQAQIVDSVIHQGYIQFLNPPILPGETMQHRWSFLHPITTLTTQAPYSTGTIAYDHTGSANEREITLTSGTWPSWAADGSITIKATTYAVETRTSNSIILLADGDNPGADIASGTSYELGRQDMDLADDFGGIEGSLTYQGQSGKSSILVVGANMIMEMRNRQTVPIRWPRYAGIRPRDVADKTDAVGQRFEILFYPTPDDAYVLTFQYIALVDKLLPAAAGSVPLGGALHGRTILASMLAEAERKLSPAVPVHRMYDLFIQQLRSSVMMDRSAMTAEFYGYNADHSDAIHAHHGHWRQHQTNYNVTYAGNLYP